MKCVGKYGSRQVPTELSSKTMATFKGLKFQHLHPGHIAGQQREEEGKRVRDREGEREMELTAAGKLPYTVTHHTMYSRSSIP